MIEERAAVQEETEELERAFRIGATARKGGKAVAVTIVLPLFVDAVTFGLGRTLRHLPDEEQIFKMVELALDEEQLAQIDQLSLEESSRVLKAWQEDSGVTLGESETSSTSTSARRARSRRT